MSRESLIEARPTSEGLPASFEAQWRRIGPQVAQRLSKKGISRDLVEDITQETGIRLYQRWEHIDLTKPVLPLAHRIARNRLVDHVRAQSRLQLEPSPVRTTRSDLTEERALSRMHLDAAVRALAKLSDRYRRLLLEDGRRTSGVPWSAADRTAKTRARRRLEALMERVPGIAVAPAGSLLRALTHHLKRARNFLTHVEPNLLANTLVGAIVLIASLASANLEGQTDAKSAPRSVAVGTSDHDGFAAKRATVTVGSEPNPLGPEILPAGSAPQPAGSQPHHLSSSKGLPEDRGNRDPAKGIIPGEPSTHVDALLGPEGLSYEGRGSLKPGDEPIEWRYKIRTRNPECVRRAYAAEISTDCSGGRAPRGYVEVEHDGQEKRVDYGNYAR